MSDGEKKSFIILCQERHPQAEELPEEPGAAKGQPEEAPGKRQEEQAVPGATRGLLQVLPDHQGSKKSFSLTSMISNDKLACLPLITIFNLFLCLWVIIILTL
jgi:hypothetical protein